MFFVVSSLSMRQLYDHTIASLPVNWPNSQITECACSISHNTQLSAPFSSEWSAVGLEQVHSAICEIGLSYLNDMGRSDQHQYKYQTHWGSLFAVGIQITLASKAIVIRYETLALFLGCTVHAVLHIHIYNVWFFKTIRTRSALVYILSVLNKKWQCYSRIAML